MKRRLTQATFHPSPAGASPTFADERPRGHGSARSGWPCTLRPARPLRGWPPKHSGHQAGYLHDAFTPSSVGGRLADVSIHQRGRPRRTFQGLPGLGAQQHRAPNLRRCVALPLSHAYAKLVMLLHCLMPCSLGTAGLSSALHICADASSIADLRRALNGCCTDACWQQLASRSRRSASDPLARASAAGPRSFIRTEAPRPGLSTGDVIVLCGQVRHAALRASWCRQAFVCAARSAPDRATPPSGPVAALVTSRSNRMMLGFDVFMRHLCMQGCSLHL